MKKNKLDKEIKKPDKQKD